MALLWMDGFDHYGGSTGNMLAGVWAEINGGSLSTSNSRTGTYSIRPQITTNPRPCRRVLGGDKETVGLGCAYYMSSLPSVNSALSIFDYRDSANNIRLSLVVESTGTLSIRTGAASASPLFTTPTPVVVAEAYQHIECAVTFAGASSAIEVRVNSVTVISLVDVTIPGGLCAQVSFGKNVTVAINTITVDIDDVFAWDGTGTTNNDFLGDRRVRTIYPDADTATDEWAVIGAVNGFAAINEASQDGDTTYIEASPDVPVTSEFELQDLPSSTGAIAAIQTYVMQRKTEAGDGNTQTSLISGVSVADGSERPITEAYTYWMDIFETDPDTGSAWTKENVDTAKLRLRRTL